ncbi:aldo/keto reductase [Brevundimonas sp.]|uniref:aldo/keto reductase n=1 Tax=Brevundimonas sp. TaxID=1871086 RepID=UPI0025DA4DD1|nr:aldo/keto reductase [Brevundimonas sp.]
MAWNARADRYKGGIFRRCGQSGLQLPAVSLGLWQNFGSDQDFDSRRAMLRYAFDQGVTHFDLANNYGPPPGSAEESFGRAFDLDFRPYRDEIIVSTKAGWPMWPGPLGDGGSRKHLIASLDQSLKRLGLDYVDIVYSHRRDPDTPIEETMSALAQACRQGKALYVGLSSYDAEDTRTAARVLAEEGVRLLVHQPRYSLLDREIESELFPELEALGLGCIVFSPLAQGLLTDKQIEGAAEGSRAASAVNLGERLDPGMRLRLGALARIARERRQTLAQMAVSWTLRDPVVTSAIVGARTLEQLSETLTAREKTDFSVEERRAIDDALGGADR